MNRLVFEDVPEGLDTIAQEERRRFNARIQTLHQQFMSIPLSILVFGQSPSRTTPVAEKRKQIRQALRDAHHNAMFSEELTNFGVPLADRSKEFIQGLGVHLIIILLEDSAGALAELHDFGSHPDLLPRMYALVPKCYEDGYSAHSVLKFLYEYFGAVHWYEPNEIEDCNVLTQALKRVRLRQEMESFIRMRGGAP